MKLVTTVNRWTEILPHFFSYYTRLGVTEFLVIVRGDNFLLAEATSKSSSFPCKIIHGHGDPRSAEDKLRDEKRTIDEHCHREPFYMIADADEFYAFPMPLQQHLEWMNSQGEDYTAGEFLDRFALNRELAPIQPCPHIWQQFPLACDFSKEVVKGNCEKAMIIRGWLRPASGHHKVFGDARKSKIKGVVHHFKWVAGTLEEMEKRIAIKTGKMRKWRPESQRVLDYFREHNGRLGSEIKTRSILPINELDAECF